MEQEEVILGARDLGKQILNIMPTYQIMLNQIEDIRKTAKLANKKSSVIEQDKKKQVFNNTIGIFGPRGAGKSSALYTLRSELSRKSNILLPLIEPDNFGENTKIIGSIIGFLKEEGGTLLSRLKITLCSEEKLKELDGYFNEGVLKPNNNLQRLLKEIVEYHLYTESQYRNILTQHFEDFAVHIKNSSQLLSPDISFREKLYELINEIIFVKTILDEPKESTLLFIFIDDIDLKTSKTRELMDTLLKFTDHPSIVTVLSGDYDILFESLTLALLADEPIEKIGLRVYDSLEAVDQPLSNSNNETKLTIMRRKSELAHEYLKKTIPSARRHQLVQWNIDTIPYFSFGQFTLSERLAQLMGDKSVFNYENLNITNIDNVRNRHLPIKQSYIIFDNRPRGLVYAYYNLIQLLSEIQTNENGTFKAVKSFVDTLILSNIQMLEYQEWLLEQCIRWGSTSNSTYIDYETGQLLNNSRNNNPGLQFFILAELIKKLLPGVQFDSLAFQSYKINLLEKYIAPKENIKSKPISYGNRLYHVMRGLVLNTDVPIAMLMIEFMSNASFDTYYYDSIWESNAREKDRFVVNQIDKLIEQFPPLFEMLYYKAQNENNQEVNTTLNIIHDLCSVPSKFEVSEKIFESLLQRFNSNQAEESSQDRELIRTLFINNLTSIRERSLIEAANSSPNELVGSMTVVHDKYRSLSEGLNNIVEKNSLNLKNKIPTSVKMAIKNRMEIFSDDLSKKIINQGKELTIKLSPISHVSIDEFMKGNAGIGKTKYKECKNMVEIIYKKNQLEFGEYKKLMKSLFGLAANNRVWYGRSEARDLYNMLQYSSELVNIFRGNESFILRLYYEYYFITTNLSEEQTYDEKKLRLKVKLDEAFNKIRTQTESEISEFSFTLEESEEQIKNDGDTR